MQTLGLSCNIANWKAEEGKLGIRHHNTALVLYIKWTRHVNW